MMAAVEIENDRMILIVICFGAAEPRMKRGHDGAVEPLIGVEHDRQHAVGVGTVENRFVHRRFALARKYLPDVSDPRQACAAAFGRPNRLKPSQRMRPLAHGAAGERHRHPNPGDTVSFLDGLARQSNFCMRNHEQVRERGIRARLCRSAAHFENAPGGAPRKVGRDLGEHRYRRAA